MRRGLYATDASPFEVAPLGVAFPEDAEDLAVLVKYCHENALPLVPRGAGTGVAGESLGPGLVVDLSAEFRGILHVGADTATVEPGVVLAELNAALAKVGRRFAPDPASAASCTVGGVVAVCGPIGFVGLMGPHICRLFIGPDHRYLTPATLLFGGAFLVICDTVARTVLAPAELPVGILTALLGGPFFIWLLLSRSEELR